MLGAGLTHTHTHTFLCVCVQLLRKSRLGLTFIFWLCHATCGTLLTVLRPGTEPVVPALAVCSLSRGTTRGVPKSPLSTIFPHFSLLNYDVLNAENLENRNK